MGLWQLRLTVKRDMLGEVAVSLPSQFRCFASLFSKVEQRNIINFILIINNLCYACLYNTAVLNLHHIIRCTHTHPHAQRYYKTFC